MNSFKVPDMTCQHCVRTITKAVQALDPAALVVIDLPAQRLDLTSQQLDAKALQAAVEAAGFTPQPL